MGAQVENQRQPNEGLELYFTQQPDYISTATFMEEREWEGKREKRWKYENRREKEPPPDFTTSS